MFVVDLLHEIELGVWKSNFTHFIRILHAHDANMVHELNQRCVPQVVRLCGTLADITLPSPSDSAQYLLLGGTPFADFPTMYLK